MLRHFGCINLIDCPRGILGLYIQPIHNTGRTTQVKVWLTRRDAGRLHVAAHVLQHAVLRGILGDLGAAKCVHTIII